MKATEQLGQPVKVYQNANVQQSGENAGRQVFETIPGETASDQRVIVRPHRTVVIRNWVVPDFLATHGSHTPAGKKILPKKTLRNQACLLRARDSSVEAMTGV